jgi:hypothetical protein
MINKVPIDVPENNIANAKYDFSRQGMNDIIDKADVGSQGRVSVCPAFIWRLSIVDISRRIRKHLVVRISEFVRR